MKIFFDTEFTGLHKNTTLISIGLISGKGDTFYAEFNDYDKSQINDWLKDNILKNLYGDNISSIADTTIVGNSEEVKNKLLRWLEQFDTVEWISDMCHYDFVLLIDLLYGKALSIPEYQGASCYDINQDIAEYITANYSAAFNLNREKCIDYIIKLLSNPNLKLKECGDEKLFLDNMIKFKNDTIIKKHNSLYDAKVIMEIYRGIEVIKYLIETRKLHRELVEK